MKRHLSSGIIFLLLASRVYASISLSSLSPNPIGPGDDLHFSLLISGNETVNATVQVASNDTVFYAWGADNLTGPQELPFTISSGGGYWQSGDILSVHAEAGNESVTSPDLLVTESLVSADLDLPHLLGLVGVLLVLGGIGASMLRKGFSR